jgi:glyoxylase I family protein
MHGAKVGSSILLLSTTNPKGLAQTPSPFSFPLPPPPFPRRAKLTVIDRDRGTMQITIREIDHVVIRCADIDSVVDFYRTVLGCPVEKEQRDLGLVQMRAGRSLIDLLAVGAKIDRPESGQVGRGRNMDHLCVRVEPFDADSLRAHLEKHGARIGEEARRYGAEGFGPSLYFFDPEGNMIELKGPPEA